MNEMKIVEKIFNHLPDDVLERLKKYIAKNPPHHINLFDVIYFQYINRLNTKELIKICNDTKICKSRNGVNNQYVKRINIIEKYLGRKITREEELVINFTRGEKNINYANLSLNEF